MKTAISIITPVYKAEKYLHRSVDCILAQTFTEFELILVDDGSPDGSGAICDEYALKDDRICVIHQENGGLSDARNSGINKANGHYIMFVDSDDYVDLDACERLLPYTTDNVDIIVTDSEPSDGWINFCSENKIELVYEK